MNRDSLKIKNQSSRTRNRPLAPGTILPLANKPSNSLAQSCKHHNTWLIPTVLWLVGQVRKRRREKVFTRWSEVKRMWAKPQLPNSNQFQEQRTVNMAINFSLVILFYLSTQWQLHWSDTLVLSFDMAPLVVSRLWHIQHVQFDRTGFWSRQCLQLFAVSLEPFLSSFCGVARRISLLLGIAVAMCAVGGWVGGEGVYFDAAVFR